LLPPFPGAEPFIECRGREDRPQFGYSSGAVVGRERAEASYRESVGRIFSDGFRPALALVCGSARIAHKNPLPGNGGGFRLGR
jgi:hypothetical protein